MTEPNSVFEHSVWITLLEIGNSYFFAEGCSSVMRSNEGALYSIFLSSAFIANSII